MFSGSFLKKELPIEFLSLKNHQVTLNLQYLWRKIDLEDPLRHKKKLEKLRIIAWPVVLSFELTKFQAFTMVKN